MCWIVLLALIGCKDKAPPPPPTAKLESLRDALLSGSAAAVTAGLETCPDQPFTAKKGSFSDECLNHIANALGAANGIVVTPPDDYAAGAAAVVIARDGRGDAFTHVDTWLNTIRTARSPGADALRLAVAERMAAAAPTVGRKFDHDDSAARAAIKSVVSAVPGACVTYWLVGNNARMETMPEPLTPDHSQCIGHDLARGTVMVYGHGVPRTLEAALQLWRATSSALHDGSAVAEAKTKPVLDAKLALIADATSKIETTHDYKAALEEMADAGTKDAGAPKLPLKPPPATSR